MCNYTLLIGFNINVLILPNCCCLYYVLLVLIALFLLVSSVYLSSQILHLLSDLFLDALEANCTDFPLTTECFPSMCRDFRSQPQEIEVTLS